MDLLGKQWVCAYESDLVSRCFVCLLQCRSNCCPHLALSPPCSVPYFTMRPLMLAPHKHPKLFGASPICTWRPNPQKGPLVILVLSPTDFWFVFAIATRWEKKVSYSNASISKRLWIGHVESTWNDGSLNLFRKPVYCRVTAMWMWRSSPVVLEALFTEQWQSVLWGVCCCSQHCHSSRYAELCGQGFLKHPGLA